MPTVPTYDTAQVMPGITPAPFRQPAQVDNDVRGRQLGEAGAALQNAGATLTQEEVNAQGMANQVRVDAALNTVRQQQLALTYDPNNGYANKKGAAALDPDPLGRSLPQQYNEQLGDTINTAAASLGNDAQRRVFGEQAATLSTSFTGDVQRHMLQEFRSFGLETQQGTIKLAADAAKLNWDAPDKIADQVQSASAAVWKAGQINGEPANLTSAKIKDTTSAIHSGVVAAALEKNEPAYALDYIQKNKGQMTADDLLKANGVIKNDVRARTATAAAQSAMDDVQRSATPPESAHIMNAAGITDNTQDGHAAAYVNGLATKYAGDSTKVLAATAIDESVVDAAIKKAGPGGDWQAKLTPAQQAKLATATTAYNAPVLPTVPSQQDVHNSIRTKLGDNPDPKVLAAALAEGTRLYTDFTADRNVQGENAVQAAQQWLIKNNGAMSALPPKLAQAVTQYAPGEYSKLGDFAGKIADPVRADNLSMYNMAKSNPEVIAKMSNTNFEAFIADNFTPRTAREIVNARSDYLNGKEDLSSQALNRPAITRALNANLDAIRIPTTHNVKDDETAKASNERLGGIRLYVDQSIIDAQRASGQKMTPAQVSAHITDMFNQDVTFKTTTLWGSTSTASQKLMSVQFDQLPAGAVEGLTKSLVASGNKAPTQTDILNLYRRTHAR